MKTNNTPTVRLFYLTVAFVVAALMPGERRDERGLSQSTENAILLAGSVTVAGIVITAVTSFVQGKLPK